MLLHRTKATAVPVRVDGFRELLLLKQLPGKLFKKCRIRVYPPLDLAAFYANHYDREAGRAIVSRLEELLGDPE
jgi:1-acyl-sn-glycerol-3-phosphate acyltransferase